MNTQELAIRLETEFRKIYRNEERYANAIRLHPYKEILQALAEAKKTHPELEEVVDYYVDNFIEKYKAQENSNLDALLEKGYDFESIIDDFKQLTSQFN